MFVTFEGIEGCGKSTQVKRLIRRLDMRKIPYVVTFEPGGTHVGQDIRRILLDSSNQGLSPLAELLLYEADRAQHVVEVVAPALEKGKWVICDRFFDATTVYQGYARRQDMALIKMLNELASLGASPQLTFLLDCPVGVGLQRALDRDKTQSCAGQDRFEREKEPFHEAVREGYQTLAREEPKRFVVLDATLSEDELEALIFEHLEPFMGRNDTTRSPAQE